MKRKVYLIIYLIMVAIIIVAGFFIDKKNKNDDAEAYNIAKNNKYTRRLYIKGEFSYEGNKICVGDLEYNDNQLMVDVAFYNYDHGNEQITVDQLYKEYNAFLNGEKVDILDKFSDYDNRDVGCDYSLYVSSINQELKNIREEKQAKGEDVSIAVVIENATPEEVREAINRVNQRGDSE